MTEKSRSLARVFFGMTALQRACLAAIVAVAVLCVAAMGAAAGGDSAESADLSERPVHLPHQHSLTLLMERGSAERCFFVTSSVLEDRMFFEYRVRSGKPLFDIVVKQPGGGVVFQSLSGEYEESEGNRIFFLSKVTGEFSLCLSNAQDTVTVTVNAAVASKKRATRKRDPVVRAVAMMKASIDALLQDQEYLRSRERAHRDTLENHNTQVVVRFVVELAVLLAMSVGQVVFLRRLFERKTSRAA
jgi:hypothetical protein